jgi:hypothetical protein
LAFLNDRAKEGELKQTISGTSTGTIDSHLEMIGEKSLYFISNPPGVPKTSLPYLLEIIDLVGSKLRVQQLPKRLETVEKLDLVSKLFCLRCRDP